MKRYQRLLHGEIRKSTVWENERECFVTRAPDVCDDGKYNFLGEETEISVREDARGGGGDWRVGVSGSERIYCCGR